MTIRRCFVDDIDSIYEIEEKSFSDPMKRATMLGDLERESYCCYGLFDGSLAAFVSYERVLDEAQIISVAVHPDKRRHGYAKKLLEAVFAIAEKEGVQLFTLEVRSDNKGAIGLYESLGFVCVGVRKNYYANPVSDALLMDLPIGKD